MSFRTEQGIVVGTPRYMAPEQALGDDADPRVDPYAGGAIGGGPGRVEIEFASHCEQAFEGRHALFDRCGE
jgi:serine/threonine protein kinase